MLHNLHVVDVVLIGFYTSGSGYRILHPRNGFAGTFQRMLCALCSIGFPLRGGFVWLAPLCR